MIQRSVDGTAERRKALADFLRSRRERIQPEEVGLVPGGRRRTPGLRREEVALLAGVGVTWYTWLEQGRDINASPQVLDAVARTLQLDRLETNHLYTLAGLQLGPAKGECSGLPSAVRKLLDQVSPYPAVVLNPRFDVLAYNQASRRVMLDLDLVPVEERNLVWLVFVAGEWKCKFIEPEAMCLRLVASYRQALADHLGDPAWRDLTDRLLANSPLFAKYWERYEVASPGSSAKVVEHVEQGLLRFEPVNLWTSVRGGHRLTVYTPADPSTERRLAAIVEGD